MGGRSQGAYCMSESDVAKVSVVMPAYNAAATLCASMDSVFAQTHAAVELLVIDDCSKDATWELIEDAAARDAGCRTSSRCSLRTCATPAR